MCLLAFGSHRDWWRCFTIRSLKSGDGLELPGAEGRVRPVQGSALTFYLGTKWELQKSGWEECPYNSPPFRSACWGERRQQKKLCGCHPSRTQQHTAQERVLQWGAPGRRAGKGPLRCWES